MTHKTACIFLIPTGHWKMWYRSLSQIKISHYHLFWSDHESRHFLTGVPVSPAPCEFCRVLTKKPSHEMSTDVQVTVVPESPESLESPLDLRTCYGQLGRGQTIKLLNVAPMSIYGIIVQKTDLWTVQQVWEVNIETLYSRYTETLWQYKLPQTSWNTFLNHGLRRLRAQTNLKSLESSKWHWMQSRQHQERCCLQVIKVMSAFWCFLMLSDAFWLNSKLKSSAFF